MHLRREWAYCDGDEEDTRPGEVILMVEALPYRIPSSFRVCVKRHLIHDYQKDFGRPFGLRRSHLGVEPKLSRELEVNLGVSALRRVHVGQSANATNASYLP